MGISTNDDPGLQKPWECGVQCKPNTVWEADSRYETVEDPSRQNRLCAQSAEGGLFITPDPKAQKGKYLQPVLLSTPLMKQVNCTGAICSVVKTELQSNS